MKFVWGTGDAYDNNINTNKNLNLEYCTSILENKKRSKYSKLLAQIGQKFVFFWTIIIQTIGQKLGLIGYLKVSKFF